MPSQSTRYFATLNSVSWVVGINGTAASKMPSTQPQQVKANARDTADTQYGQQQREHYR